METNQQSRFGVFLLFVGTLTYLFTPVLVVGVLLMSAGVGLIFYNQFREDR